MNDMILNLLANDSFTVSDFKAAGLTADNTKLESEEKYKSSQMIQENELFQDEEGNFDEQAFHQYYLGATEFYNRLADETYLEDITKNTYYSKDNIFAPEESKKIDETPKFVVSPNPFLQNNSLTRVGKKGDRTLSISEIAQSQKIYDSEKQKFGEESVNDRALGNNPFKWLGDLFSEPLVIAQWDEDGEHTDLLTGEKKKHKKGDYKYNEDGTFYYETLNGRDVYGKQVLNRMNTLTVDGSAANAYDFFDSDDLQQKSIIGNTMKNLALVGSMFLPVVGNYVAAASIATQSLGLLGALGKMFLGSENETANTLHAWAKTVNRQSTSEYASQNTWCWENLINMIGDTVGQLKEQRYLFTHVPALFKGTTGIKAQNTKTYESLVDDAAKEISKKTGKTLKEATEAIKHGRGTEAWVGEMQELGLQHATISKLKAQAQLEKYMEGYRHLGSIMSKAYMTGITVQDTYGEAKANGASDLEAFALTLGYAAGEAWILNTGLGEWIMPELQGDKLKYRAMINALKKEIKPLTDNLENTATAEGRRNVFKQIFNIGKRVATDDIARKQLMSKTADPLKVIAAHATGEAFEELSEEVLADFSKSAFNAVNWLRGDETRMTGAWENIGDRYGMSLLGGFIGGGISSAATDFKQVQQLAKMTNETAIQEIIYMVNNDKIDDFLKFANKQTLGPKNLKWETDENGNYLPGDKNSNQDKEIKMLLNQQVQLIKDTINAEGAKFSENALFDALTLKDLRYLQLRNTRTAGLMFQEYNSICAKIYEKSKRIRELTQPDSDKKKELTPEQAGEVSQLKQELNELRVQKDAIISGKRAPEFIATALYEATQALHGHKTGYQFQTWAEKQSNKKFEELSESDKEKYKKEYLAYRDTDMKNDILGDARQFVDLVGLASGAIQGTQDYIDNMLTTGRESSLKLQTYLGNMLDLINVTANEEDLDLDTFLLKVQADLNNSISKVYRDQAIPLLTPEAQTRLDYIEQVQVDENYTEDMKKLDKISVILETFADYTDTITNQFIQQGFIHPEVKAHLIQTYEQAIKHLEDIYDLEGKLGINAPKNDSYNVNALSKFSAYLGKSEEEIQDEVIDDRQSLLWNYSRTLKQKIEQIKELNHTPIIDLLESFKVATSDSDISVKDVMEKVRQIVSENYFDVSDLAYGQDLGKQMNEVEEIIDLYASALYATRIDKSATNNAWGYSKTLNELNRKYGNDQWVQLAEIEGEKAELIMQDLALVKQKLQFAKNLHAVNSGQKLSKQTKVGYNKQFIFFNKFERLVNYLEEDRNKWKLESLYDVRNSIKLLKDYNSKYRDKRKLSLTPDEKVQIEKESLALDDALYKFFEDNSELLTNVDTLSKLLVKFQLFDPAINLLNDETEDLDDNQFIFSLAAKVALKGSKFYNTLRKTFNNEKAPVPMQEQAVYLNVAMALNGDVMNHFAKAYAKGLFDRFKNDLDTDQRKAELQKLGYFSESDIKFYAENPDYFQSDSLVDKFANIILTEGIAGSGKSGGVFDSTVRVLKEIKPEILDKAFFVHSTLANAEASINKLGLTGKAFSSSNDEKDKDLISYFYSDYTSDYKNKIKIINGAFTHTFKLKEDLKDLPKVIFLDEASRYDYVKMKLLSEAAQHYGIAVFAAGDFDQISAKSSLNVDGKTANFAPHRLNFIRSSKLGLSFRTLNNQMSKNQKEVQANLHTPGKKIFNMHYWEDDKEIRGFKVYNDKDFDQVVESINKIKKLLKPDEKIGFLYTDENLSMHKKLQEKFGDLLDVKKIDDAQGLEGQYYIIDLNQAEERLIEVEIDGKKETRTYIPDEQQLRQEFYTAFTRAEKGGLIINSSNPSAALKAAGIKDETSELESISEKAIATSSKNRKEIFDKIFEGKSEETIDYKPLTPVKKETVVFEPSEEKVEEEGFGPEPPATETPIIPSGFYLTREEAAKVDLSAYKNGFELLDPDDNVIGTITGTTIYELNYAGDKKDYFVPAVEVKMADGKSKLIYYSDLSKYKLKDPSESKLVPKYKVGDVFYDADGNPLEITEVIEGTNIEYKVKDHTGKIQTVLEDFFADYSMTPPVIIDKEGDGSDLGENEDPGTYRRRTETENGSKNEQRIESDGRINHWMYTFNSYETGVLWDEDGKIKTDHFSFDDDTNPVAQRTKARVDNVNGLINLRRQGLIDYGVLNKNTTKEECLDILDRIHGVLMHNPNNQEAINEIANILGVTDPKTLSTIQFGIKSSSMISSKDSSKLYGTRDEDSEWHPFDKHRDEISEYAQPDVISGDKISRKTVVAVFRDADGKKVFEITLGVMNSPLTIGQMQDQNGAYIYPEIGVLLEQLTPDSTGEEIFKVCSECEAEARKQNYHDLANLFKSFLFTSNAYAPLVNADGSEFNLAQSMKQGPNIIKKKGDYQKNGERKYEAEYMDLSELAKDKRIIVSDIWVPNSNTYNGKTYAHINPGHACVFVSYNPAYKKFNKNDLASLYIQQLESATGPKDIEMYYIIPPEASVKEYLQNFRNAYMNQVLGGTRPVVAIGNIWTSYKLLKNIYEGGELTADKLRIKLLDYVEFDEVVDYVKKLIEIEKRTDWEGDDKYELLLEQYQKLYSNKEVAKKYAIRNTILHKQQAILQSNFSKSITQPVYKVLTSYISNAAYWTKTETVPHKETIDLIEKYNKGTIKYKIRLNPNSNINIGMFARAKVSSTNPYALETMNEDGSLSTKEFQINGKIDPPIFESEAFKTAIGILAQWEYEDPNDTSSRKIMQKPLNDASRGYLRNGKNVKKPKNNFEKLKDINKIYFEPGGLLANITVDGENDPSLDQLHFATEVLSKFNSQPNNLGFAVAQSDGSIKLHVFKITDFTNGTERPEMETFTSLGGITVGIPLIFKSNDDELNFSSTNRDYKLSINGKELILQHSVKQDKYSNITKVQYSDSVVINQDVINGALEFINNPENGFNPLIRGNFKGLTYKDLLALSPFDLDLFKQQIEDTLGTNLETIENQNMLMFYNFLKNGPVQTININIGDRVSLSDTTFVPNKVVDKINGNLITFTDGTSVDLETDPLFKADKKVIDCVKYITIPYGK